MNSKKAVSIGFIAVLLTSFATILPIQALEYNGGNWICVDPPYIEGGAVGSDFYVNINISATGVFGIDWKFQWNNTLIGLYTPNATIDIVPDPPWSPYLEGLNQYTEDVVPGIDEHYAGYSATGSNTYTGNATICTYHFKVLYAPAMGDPDINSTLDLVDEDTIMLPLEGEYDPPPDIYDGLYSIKAAPPPVPDVAVVDPTDGDHDFEPAYEEEFWVDIEISDMHPIYEMWGWEVTLYYNTTHKEFLNATEGDFLKDFEGVNGTFFGFVTDTNYVILFAVFCGDPASFPSGGGVLGSVQFKEINETEYPDIQESELGIVPLLADAETWPPEQGGIPIETITNGTNHVPYFKLGRDIDSFTDPYRKYGEKHFTEYIGLGPHMNADAYQPQDIVILYALVTYAEDPVQGKLVQFEVHPPNDVEGFPLYRTAITNATGIANITFTIPWPCDHPERVLGKWFVYQSVEIACVKVNDTEWFEVGWTIWLTDVSVRNAKKCTNATVTFCYKNIAIGPFYDEAIPIFNETCSGPIFQGFEYIQRGEDPHDAKLVYFTAVIYDDLGVPIGSYADWLWVPNGVWCHPYVDCTEYLIHIPKWAFVGEGTVYVNAYTGICSECGLPYCPEISTTFPISRQ